MPAFIAIGLAALLSAAPSFAQNLAEFPGWRLDQTTPQESVDPASLEYKDFFALTPPDARPPITVDGGTAARLLNGQANPETIYTERTTGGTDKKKEDGSSGGNGAVGWQVAESTYVPVGEEKSRNPATALTGSSTYGGIAGNGATSGVNVGSGGAGSMAANPGGRSGAGNGFSAAGGSMGFANSGSGFNGGSSGAFNAFSGGGSGSGSGAFNGGTSARPAAYNGGTGGASSSSADTSNMTYSQMIDRANAEATKAACARMGSYAQGGFCK